MDRVRDGTFDNPPDPARVWAFLAVRSNELVVALDRGEVVGFAFGTMVMKPDKPTGFFVDEVGVHEDYLRQGIATRLLERIMDRARDRGCEHIWLATEGDNDAALGLYRSMKAEEQRDVVVLNWPLD